jgi:hypothetical protein
MTLRTDLFALFNPLISLPNGKVIWQDLNSPRPLLPYIAMKVMSQRFVNYDYYKDPDVNGIQTVQGDRELTLNIQYIGDDSVQNLEAIVDKLRLQTVIDTFMAAKYVAFNTAQVVDIAALLSGAIIEPRASLDVFIRTKKYQTDNVGLISTVNIAASDNSSAGPYTIQAVVVS